MACCIGLMLFASCKKDPIAPTIDIQKGEGFVYENAQVYSGDEIMVGFYCTGESLTQIEIVVSQNGTILDSYIDNCTNQKNDPVPPYHCEHIFTIEATGTVNIKGTVTDAIGQTATKSFNVLYEEKPNAKFLGEYQGNALFSGTMEASVTGMDPIQQEVTDIEMPTILTISEGETMNEVVVTYKINDQESTANGTVDGDKVNIVLADVPYTFNYQMNGFALSPTLVLNLNLVATLVDNQLQLEGTCNGNGEINLFVYNGTMSIDGTIGGSLTKE